MEKVNAKTIDLTTAGWRKRKAQSNNEQGKTLKEEKWGIAGIAVSQQAS